MKQFNNLFKILENTGEHFHRTICGLIGGYCEDRFTLQEIKPVIDHIVEKDLITWSIENEDNDGEDTIDYFIAIDNENGNEFYSFLDIYHELYSVPTAVLGMANPCENYFILENFDNKEVIELFLRKVGIELGEGEEE
jgi:hypothetical protein